MTKQQAIDIFNSSKFADVGYDRIKETPSYFIFSLNADDVISDPIAVDKKTGKIFGYNPIEDGI